MVMEDKDIWIKIGFIIIKLERRETEISPFLFKENDLSVFLNQRKKYKGLTTMWIHFKCHVLLEANNQNAYFPFFAWAIKFVKILW